ncbi:hypothetical protein D3C71_2034040 [compost metagenome]
MGSVGAWADIGRACKAGCRLFLGEGAAAQAIEPHRADRIAALGCEQAGFQREEGEGDTDRSRWVIGAGGQRAGVGVKARGHVEAQHWL